MLSTDKPPATFHAGFMSNGISPAGKKQMYDAFQTWALKTYGDSGKTKTVTRKKYDRIVRILTGEEEANTENSKFRFWVKAKGFKLGPGTVDGRVQNVLYVPVKPTVSGLSVVLYNVVTVCLYKFCYIIGNVVECMDEVRIGMDEWLIERTDKCSCVN